MTKTLFGRRNVMLNILQINFLLKYALMLCIAFSSRIGTLRVQRIQKVSGFFSRLKYLNISNKHFYIYSLIRVFNKQK